MMRIDTALNWAKENNPTAEKCVYVIGGDGGTTKIGIATNPARRLRDIKTNSGRTTLTVVASWKCDQARAIERCAHMLLQQDRAGGEWFNTDPEQAVNIINAVMSAAKETRKHKEYGGGESDKRVSRAVRPVTAGTGRVLDIYTALVGHFP